MPFISYFPYPVYVGSILMFVIMIICAMIKGYDQLRNQHWIPIGIVSIVLGILLIIIRAIKEFKIFTSLEQPLLITSWIIFAIFMIYVFILAIPKLRYDHYHRNIIIICGILLLICICLGILAYKFPDFFNAPFKRH